MEDIFGVPGKGMHTHFMGVAWRDVVGTVVIGVGLAYLLKRNVVYTVLFLFFLGIVLHRLFNVRTTVDQFLFR